MSKSYLVSYLYAVFFSVSVILLFLLASPEKFAHWFLIPLFFCGVLISVDAIEWARNKISIFDPKGIVGILGVHFFFLAPLLHVYWNYWMGRVSPPEDWRVWLGYLAAFNSCGLIIYKMARKIRFKNRFKYVWEINYKRFFVLGTLSLIITLCFQIFVYSQYGGISGYINAYAERNDNFSGSGMLFAISESFPIILMMMYVVYLKKHNKEKKWWVLLLVLLLFFILRMFFGGFRGSRSNTIWALFWAVGLLHFWVKPISKKIVIGGIIFLLFFMYIYGLYKGAGTEFVEVLGNEDIREEVQDRTGRTFETVVLGDLGRSDVQSYILYKIYDSNHDNNYGYGSTYVGALNLLIPKSLIEERVPTKIREGTNFLYGEGTYENGITVSSRIYGLFGEALLNFGPVLAIFSFIIFGFYISWLRGMLFGLKEKDSRFLIFPFLIVMAFLMIVNDSDNMIFALIKNCLVPFLVIYFSSIKVERSLV